MQLSFLKGYGLHTAKLLFSGETVSGGDGWWVNFSFVELLTKVVEALKQAIHGRGIYHRGFIPL
jgi:hypothetical protein